MNNEQLWQAILGEIELSLSRANFTTWFKNTFISSLENGRAIICVPNTFTKAWLEKKYHKEIAGAFKNLCALEIKEILYKVETKKESPLNDLIKRAKTENIAENKPKIINRFGLNNRYVFETFIVGKNNELAHAACQAVAPNPSHAYSTLFIYGGVGLGKTHLL